MSFSDPTGVAGRLVKLDRAHLWRPYTARQSQLEVEPLVVARAEGPWLWDASGQRYFDGFGSWWVSNLGHQHPRLVAALRAQSERLCHASLAGMINEATVDFARRLAACCPGDLNRVFFSDNGSTAVEVALKMAHQYFAQNGQPRRQRVLALSGAFHGDTVGAMSAGDIPEFQRVFANLLFAVWRPRNDDFEAAAEALSAHLDQEGDSVAAVIVEPMVQGAGGMRFWSGTHLRRLAAATHRAGALLIADEVFTGYGRTGPMWASAHAQVVPDILCTAKGLSGGVLPFAATVTSERVFEGFGGDGTRALMHGHTFCGNPLGAAVARAVLDVYEDEHILAEAVPKAARIAAAFARFRTHAHLTNPRALGMVAAVEIEGPAGYHAPLGQRVHVLARRKGLWLRPLGNTVYITPPLNTTESDLDFLLDTLEETLDEVTRGLN